MNTIEDIDSEDFSEIKEEREDIHLFPYQTI